MTKKKAINIIIAQKAKIENFDKDHIWLDITLSYFKDFFGENSNQYVLLHSWTHGTSELDLFNKKSKDQINAERNSSINRLSNLLDECVEVIKNKGIIQHEKQKGFDWKELLKYCLYSLVFGLILGYIIGAYDNPKAEIMHSIKDHLHLR